MSQLPPIPDPFAPQKSFSWRALLVAIFNKVREIEGKGYGLYHFFIFLLSIAGIGCLTIMNMGVGLKRPDGTIIEEPLLSKVLGFVLLFLVIYCPIRGFWLLLLGNGRTRKSGARN